MGKWEYIIRNQHKWEDRIRSQQRDNIERVLNEMGDDGWELVSTEPIRVLNDGETEIIYADPEVHQEDNWRWGSILYFKRPHNQEANPT